MTNAKRRVASVVMGGRGSCRAAVRPQRTAVPVSSGPLALGSVGGRGPRRAAVRPQRTASDPCAATVRGSAGASPSHTLVGARRWLCAIVLMSVAVGAVAGEAEDRKGDVLAKSLPLRTALHRDPSLGPPFERLVTLFRAENRTDELVAIYRAHVAQFPADWRGLTVLIRLLTATGAPEARARSADAVQRFADNAYLHYLRYKVLEQNHDAGALDALDAAIAREQLPGRKRAWLDELLPKAIADDRTEVAEKHLKALVGGPDATPDAMLDVARKMLRFKFYALARDTLEAALKAKPAPELGVTIDMAAATAEVGLNQQKEAAARLDRLLSRLTPDYWRRAEIVRRRIALVATEAERQAMLEAARDRVAAKPKDEGAVLDLAQLLVGFELRRDALKGLREAGRRLTGSMAIEKLTLELYDRLRDSHGRVEYLAERLKAQPDRKDLRLRHVKSLAMLGRRKDATAELERLVGELAPAEKATQLLEVARFLRRASLTVESTRIFEQVVKLLPTRLDVRRELAETFLAIGRRKEARDLFSRTLPTEVAMENLLDVVPFLMDQRMYREARTALRARLKDAATNLDIRLLLITIEARIANHTSGSQLIAETRDIADTSPRYRRWLEGAVAFHDTFETVSDLLAAERERLDADRDDWSKPVLERRLIFADVAAQTRYRDEVAKMLQADIDTGPPPAVRKALRRRLIAVLQEARGADAPIEQQLKTLAQEDPDAVHECNARLALLYQRTQRPNLVGPLLKDLKIQTLRDTDVLARLEPLFASQGNRDMVLAILQRLTALDPTVRGHWQRWLAALAAAGDETRLRGAIRRLLAGIERMPLAAETRDLLQAHLIDSYWRSVAELVAQDKDAALADALPLLEAVERAAHERNAWLWVTWTRAHVLNRLGRVKPRDEAIAELARVARLPVLPPPEPKGDKEKPREDEPKEKEEELPKIDGIVFPDGLVLSLEQAMKLLKADAAKPPARKPADRRGPVPALGVKWAFETLSAPITGLLPLDKKRLLVSDLSGSLYCVDIATGKLVWDSDEAPSGPSKARGATAAAGARPAVSIRSMRAMPGGSVSHTPGQFLPPRPIADGKGHILMPSRGGLECLSATDGRLLWRAALGASPVGASGAAPPVSVALRGDRVLVFEPLTSTAAAFDGANGKLVWERTIQNAKPVAVSWMNSGACLSGDRFFVYGAASAVLDADTGDLIWSFDPSRLKQFPIEIKEPPDPNAQPMPTVVTSPVIFSPPHTGPYLRGYSGLRRSYSPGYAYRAPQPPRYVNYLTRSTTHLTPQQMPTGAYFAAPAVVWAQATGARHGVLDGERLLLLGGQSQPFLLRLDLPLAARPISVNGTFIGMAGSVACFLSQHIQLANLETLQIQRYGLKELHGGQQYARVQATVDGILVYLTGPNGVLCVNAKTAHKVFAAPWPKAIAPKQPLPVPQSRQYYWQGISDYLGNNYGPCLPLVDRVIDGTLLATVTPTRVVALVERRADGD